MTSKRSFNLVDRDWLPVATMDGRVREVSLRELFARAHELARLELESPDVMAGVYRMLLAIIHRAYDGPKSLEAWGALWRAGRFDEARVEAYLKAQHEHLDLWHLKRPFMQDAAAEGEMLPVSRLYADRAKGNNPTLFDHSVDDEVRLVPSSEAARRLLGAQILALGGRIAGAATNAVDGPCARGATFLVLGDSLFETLALNTLVWTKSRPVPGDGHDRPSWEHTVGPTEARAPHGHLELMTWQPRRYRLVAGDDTGLTVQGVVAVGEGHRCVRPEGHRDPFMAQRLSATAGLLDVRVDEERALWRESLPLYRGDTDDGRRPAALEQLASVRRQFGPSLVRERSLRVSVFGFATDQAKVALGRVETLPLPLKLLTGDSPEGVEFLRDALSAGEEAARKLRGAVYAAGELALAPGADQREARRPRKQDVEPLINASGAIETYWSRLGSAFPGYVLGLGENAAAAHHDWAAAVKDAAWAGFERSAVKLGESPRGLKAIAIGRRQLASALHTLFPPEQETTSP